jgi:catechol 2,3-dioxygenase-like lactoylglutathione lyase family enzyme
MKPAKLVHIAVRFDDPRRLADFYKRAFGVKEVLSNRRAIDLWDGYLFLAINPPSATGPKGLNHFGFLVEDVEAFRPILSEAGAPKWKPALPADPLPTGAFTIPRAIPSIFPREVITKYQTSAWKREPRTKRCVKCAAWSCFHLILAS